MWPRSLAGWRSSGHPPESSDSIGAVEVDPLGRTSTLARRALAREPSLQAAILEPELQRLLANGGEVPGAADAMHALTSDTAQKMHDFYWAILGVPREGSTDTTLRLTATEMRDYADAIQAAAGNRSWKPFFFCSLARLQVVESRGRTAGEDQRGVLRAKPGARRRCPLVALSGRVHGCVLQERPVLRFRRESQDREGRPCGGS